MRSSLVLLILVAVFGESNAQETDPGVLATWIALDAPVGHEHHATEALEAVYPGWTRDRSGNLLKSVGEGSPHKVVACGLDANAYLVTQITNEGYLRLHRVGRGSNHPLWDQAHEGQHLRILTRGGPVIGISAVANGHFASQHRGETAVISQDDLWVDVGLETAEEVREAGIALMDPVVRQLPAWSYADEAAGPSAGARIGCAAVFAAGEAGVHGPGRTTYVLSTQHTLGWIGLGGAVRLLGDVDTVLMVGPGDVQGSERTDPRISGYLRSAFGRMGVEEVTMISPAIADPGALMERVTGASAQVLLDAVVEAVNGGASRPDWHPAPSPASIITPLQTSAPDIIAVARQLDALAEISAVPGHEGPIRERVLEALPAWARAAAESDSMGNVWVDAGPKEGEATIFIAHMDEVGYRIRSIGDDGVVELDRAGGPVASAWEGQPALIQLDASEGLLSARDYEELRGVFLSRPDPVTKRPAEVRAWFGMDGAALAAAGVAPGLGVTGYKEGHVVGVDRYAARSLDDRVGTTALLLAVQQLDLNQLPGRVIFAWSVQEESGLFGASALAERFGPETRRAYSVDTFVSSDTPLESPHFAFAPLGGGPVLRSAENSGLVVPDELDRNRSVAAEAGLRVQIGLTQGGTDGTTFSFFGAPNAGLSWPGRYSHSPAEIADLSDVAGLVALIRAFAMAAGD
ncbi:MAG: putative aminopeptidase FrvX [Rhodothermales bacterium]|jgi:putative aminopeptidase FrvX